MTATCQYSIRLPCVKWQLPVEQCGLRASWTFGCNSCSDGLDSGSRSHDVTPQAKMTPALTCCGPGSKIKACADLLSQPETCESLQEGRSGGMSSASAAAAVTAWLWLFPTTRPPHSPPTEHLGLPLACPREIYTACLRGSPWSLPLTGRALVLMTKGWLSKGHNLSRASLMVRSSSTKSQTPSCFSVCLPS